MVLPVYLLCSPSEALDATWNKENLRPWTRLHPCNLSTLRDPGIRHVYGEVDRDEMEGDV